MSYRRRDLVDDLNMNPYYKLQKSYDMEYLDEKNILNEDLYEGIIECDACGEGIDKPMRFIKKTGHDYCNKECFDRGLTPLHDKIRSCKKYRIWRDKILKRDNYTCQECGLREDQHVHHIEHFTKILNNFLYDYNQFNPEEDKETLLKLSFKYKPFWKVNNGITLCKECHILEHTSE